MTTLSPKLVLSDDFPPVEESTWRAVVEKDLKGAPFEKRLITSTYEGIDLKPVYTFNDWSAAEKLADLPGCYPFTRGSTSLGSAACGWDIRQQQDHPDLERANALVLEDLARGVTSLQLRLDVAARRGLGPDTVTDREWLGRDGLMVYTVADLDALLAGVHPEMIGLALEAGAAFLPAASVLAAYWASKGVADEKARGAFNADPLAVLARDGELPTSLDESMGQMRDLAVWTSGKYRSVRSVRVGSAPYHHAGATAAQDLGLSMATAVAYLRELTDAGLDVNAAAKQLLFSYGLGTNFFLAMAKLRAARRLWARVLEASGGDTSPAAGTAMLIQARTSKRVLTQRDPWVNMLRNTATTFAAASAGAQIITTEPFDAALGASDEFGKRIARNTQVILAEESQLGRVVDPAGGSWFIESLTDELCEKGWAFFQQVEAQGGMAAALTSGWVQDQIDSAFAPRLKNIARRRDAITGVSEFPNLGEKPVKKETIDINRLREEAKARTCEKSLSEADLADVKRLSEPGVERVATAVRLAGSCARISQLAAPMFRSEPATARAVLPHPYAAPFEELRDASDRYLEMTGHRPRVFLANLGPVAHHTARAAYSTNFFEAGGFEVVGSKPLLWKTDEELTAAGDAAIKAFVDSGASVVVLCSSDKLYPQAVPAVTERLKAAGARTVVLAGAPGDSEADYRKAGVDRFIFIKCDVLNTLRELLSEEGVLS
ncbi:methylmalonyl-CoA mutase family protein [Mucisphaera calidilacus]|uniref:methylmalonyl-CoA mutase n=1 Tax=Mucisphaera calidilacus TaxID=2527982 RepID=A0A518C0X5_9BACT|nr:methylmalonyl-CoA mutase family protein [Mucisphaera calidilacus]QDU72860.1 Methylmalonyl-CoA mutase small subunit [Mucisphaera calidilacus]